LTADSPASPTRSHPKSLSPPLQPASTPPPGFLARCHRKRAMSQAAHLPECSKLLKRLVPGFRLVRRLQVSAQFRKQQTIGAIPKTDDHFDRLQKGTHQALIQQA